MCTAWHEQPWRATSGGAFTLEVWFITGGAASRILPPAQASPDADSASIPQLNLNGDKLVCNFMTILRDCAIFHVAAEFIPIIRGRS
jgi:hypothetical protein